MPFAMRADFFGLSTFLGLRDLDFDLDLDRDLDFFFLLGLLVLSPWPSSFPSAESVDTTLLARRTELSFLAAALLAAAATELLLSLGASGMKLQLEYLILWLLWK